MHSLHNILSLSLSCITSASIQALLVLEGTTDLKAFPVLEGTTDLKAFLVLEGTTDLKAFLVLEGTTDLKASLVLKVPLGLRVLQGQRAHKVQVEERAAKERQDQKVPQGHQGQETLVHVSTRKRRVWELRQDKAWTRTSLFTSPL